MSLSIIVLGILKIRKKKKTWVVEKLQITFSLQSLLRICMRFLFYEKDISHTHWWHPHIWRFEGSKTTSLKEQYDVN